LYVVDSYLQDKPPELRHIYAEVVEEGPRNAVLNHLEAGLAAMYYGRHDLAEYSFDEALLGIETVYSNTERARKARSLWYEEGMKDFKGEPYERAMAYYYRGLLFLRRGDFENATACFRNGVLQDAFAEEEQNRCDFALLIFMEGWASQCLGDMELAEAAYDEVKILRPDFKPPGRNHNTLIIAETGTSPRKVADGIGHYELKYRRGKHFTEKAAHISIAGKRDRMYPIEDIFWQSSTRGGRLVDKIVEGKAVFRKTHEEIGTALTDVSANALIFSPSFGDVEGDVQKLSAALGLIGIAEMATAARTKPHADTRYWCNLPDAVHVFTCNSEANTHTITISFLDSSGSEIFGLRKKCEIELSDTGHGIAWIKSCSAIPSNQLSGGYKNE